MLQPRTAIFNVEAFGFCPVKRRISSSAGRLRKKNVPVNCLRFARRQISLSKFVPHQRMGIVFRSVVGSCIHSHEFSRIYRLTGDLLRSNNSGILHLATLESPSTKRLGKATSLHRPFIGLESRKRSSSSMGIDSFQPKLVDVWKVKASPLLQRPLRLGRGRASVCH